MHIGFTVAHGLNVPHKIDFQIQSTGMGAKRLSVCMCLLFFPLLFTISGRIGPYRSANISSHNATVLLLLLRPISLATCLYTYEKNTSHKYIILYVYCCHFNKCVQTHSGRLLCACLCVYTTVSTDIDGLIKWKAKN